MTYRDIPTVPIAPARINAPKGVPGELRFVPLSSLVIDPRYQREISEIGRTNVRNIGENFDWSRFTPLVVAPAEIEGKLAIIDGQHRAAAAKARGDITLVPCWLIQALTLQQAQAFIAINAKTTHVTTTAVWYARLAAAEPDAIAAFEVCKKAGVQIMRFPDAVAQRTASQTVAVVEIHKARVFHGDGAVIKALKILVHAGQLRGRCLLTRSFIRAVVNLCRGEWNAIAIASAAVRLRAIDPEKVEAKAVLLSRSRGGTRAEHVVHILRETVAGKKAA